MNWTCICIRSGNAGVTGDLKRIFPKIQFLTTTHSPQVIGGVEPQEIIRLLPDGGHDVPAQSFGMDTNWILEVLMDADKEEPSVKHGIEAIFNLIAERRLDDRPSTGAGITATDRQQRDAAAGGLDH